VVLVYMTHMNIDFDGAPNAYGPPSKNPLDSLHDAGRDDPRTGYYGLIAVGPNEVVPGDKHKRLIKDVYHLKLDEHYPDTKDRCPVVQQTGPYAGFYVSATAKHNPSGSSSIYEQSHYLDSSAVAYCALSGGLHRTGVGGNDFGLALRHDNYRQASFAFLSGEGANNHKVGECSYKVFLDIGGTPKTSAERYANNNFPTTFIVFPGSRTSQLIKISLADNPEDFAVFVALQAQIDARSRGGSGLPVFHKYVAGGRKTKPMNYESVVTALRTWGYAPALSTALGAARTIASDLAGTAGSFFPLK
jgi:hypothetical protein